MTALILQTKRLTSDLIILFKQSSIISIAFEVYSAFWSWTSTRPSTIFQVQDRMTFESRVFFLQSCVSFGRKEYSLCKVLVLWILPLNSSKTETSPEPRVPMFRVQDERLYSDRVVRTTF